MAQETKEEEERRARAALQRTKERQEEERIEAQRVMTTSYSLHIDSDQDDDFEVINTLPVYGANQSGLGINSRPYHPNRMLNNAYAERFRTTIYPRVDSTPVISNLEGEESKPITIICVICLTNKPNYVSVPCGHTLTCHTCHPQFWNTSPKPKCPQCKGSIDNCMKLFLQVDESDNEIKK